MTRSAKVLWLTKGLGRGGAERLLCSSAPHIEPSRFEVEVAYVLPWKDGFVGHLERQGIPTHCLGGGRRMGTAWIGRLRRLVREGAFDIIHTHSPVPAAVLRLLERRTDVKIIHTEHNVWARYRLPTRVLNAATYGRNAGVIAVSHGVADSIRRPWWARWVTMPPGEVIIHGIDEALVCRGPEARARARRTLGLEDGEQVVGTVGNFTPKKSQRTLLQAFRVLLDEHERRRLVLVGEGPLEQDLRAAARYLGLGDRVLFAGSRDDVQEILPAFDVFALSSLHEGLSIALVEALAAGVPAVGSRVGGIPEVVRDGEEGLLVPPSNPQALAAALRKLLDDDGLRADMAERAIVRARRFSIEPAARRTEDLYDEVLGRR